MQIDDDSGLIIHDNYNALSAIWTISPWGYKKKKKKGPGAYSLAVIDQNCSN